MKSIITAFCLLIPLVILLVIIDRKDFYSCDEVAVQQETVTGWKTTMLTMIKPNEQQTETKPVVETKPITETKPTTEAKPVETKPDAETKSVETKPTESKSVAETKPATTKPIETMPVAETKLKIAETETKPVAETITVEVETKPVAEEILTPLAIPVVTTEEAEKLNAEAMVFAEKYVRRTYFMGKGMNLVYDDKMTHTRLYRLLQALMKRSKKMV